MKKNLLLAIFIFAFQWVNSQSVLSKPDLVLLNHNDDVTSLAYAPYNKMIASGSWDNSINLYSDEGKYIRSIKKHTAAVEALCFSRDGKYLFSGSNDFTAMQFDAATGNSINIFSGHTANITAITVDAANKYLFTGSDDGTIKIWDLTQSGTLFKTISVGSSVHSMALSNDGKSLFVCANSKDLIQYDMAGKELKRFSGHTDFLNALAISLNNKYIATASNDKKIIVWDAKLGSKVRELSSHTLKVNCVIFSYDSKYIISGSNDGTCRIWETETGKELYTLNDNQENKIRAITINFDKKKLFSAAKMKNQADYGVRMWSLPMDSLDKSGSKTIIGGAKDDKNNGLSNTTTPAVTNKDKPKSNPAPAKAVTPPGSTLKTVDSTKVTQVADSEAMIRAGKIQPKKVPTTINNADTAKNKTAKNNTVKPAGTNPTALDTSKRIIRPATAIDTTKRITRPATAPQKPNAPMTKADRIKQAQMEKERKEQEEKEKLEMIEKQRTEREKAIQDSIDEEEAKPKSKFKKLR
jgi:WD40 repeat protein